MLHRRLHLLALLIVFATACIQATMPAGAANAPIDLTLNVASQTTLDISGCSTLTPNITQFGTVLPGTTAKTGSDCVVNFGSSNESSSLLVSQSDGTGTALTGVTDTWALSPGSDTAIWRDVSTSGGTMWALMPGSAWRSMDNGLTWPQSNTGMGASPKGISVPTAASAWVATGGTTVRRTINGNLASPTWNATTVAPGMPDFPAMVTNGIAATSANDAWVVGDGGIIRSTANGGATNWTNIPSGTTNDLIGMRRSNANRVAIWASGSFLLTTIDNGASFKQQTLFGTYGINDVWMISDDIVVVARAGGQLWRTTNNTAATPTWGPVTTDTPWNINGFWFTNATDGWAVGDYGLLLRTSDAGATWTRSHARTTAALTKTVGPTAGTIVAVGVSATAMVSTDDGATWNDTGPNSRPTYLSVSMTYDGAGWRVGSRGAISRTTNGGSTWSTQTSGTGNDLFDVYALDPNRAVAVGRHGTILATTDGGTSWSLRTSNTTEHLYGVDGDKTVAWAVGEGGTILKTVDAGWTWTVEQTVPGTTLHTVSAPSTTNAVAFGSNLAYRTTDGATWTGFTLPPAFGSGTVTISTVVPTSNAIVYTRSGTVVRSTDGGFTWTQIAGPGALNGIRDVAFSTPQVAYAGGNGIMRKSTNGGATWSSMPGGVTSYWNYGLDASERTRIISVGAGGLGGFTVPANSVPDYQVGSNDWSGVGTGAFAMCLRATSVTPSWTVNATCDQSTDGAHWRGVPLTTGPSSEVVSSAAPVTNAEARFRFGVRLPNSQAFGELYAGITFVVIAPEV